ncbi:host specificity J domain protein [Escherichia coli]|nr:host specificity J domain protein [Escherichia coli]
MDNGAHFDGDQSGTVKRCHAASSAAPDRRSHRRQRGISGAGALGHAEGGEGCELYASPDRGSG